MSKQGVEAVDRALSLLEAFNRQRQTMTLTELATATGLYKEHCAPSSGFLGTLSVLGPKGRRPLCDRACDMAAGFAIQCRLRH